MIQTVGVKSVLNKSLIKKFMFWISSVKHFTKHADLNFCMYIYTG